MKFKNKINYLARDIKALFSKTDTPNHYSNDQIKTFCKELIKSYKQNRNTGFNARAYDAASVGRLRDWEYSSENVYQELQRDIPILIARSKDQIKNNAIAKSIINIYDSQIVANGLRVTPRPLNKSNELDSDLQAKISYYWDRFVDECSLSGHTFNEMQNAALNSMISTGGIFTNFVNADNFIGFKVQVADQQFLDFNRFTTSTSNNNLCAGIELNNLHQPLNYYFANNVVVPASKLIHSYRLVESNQFIGIPWLSSTLPLLYDINELIQNVSIASQIQASISLWVQPDSEFPADSDIDESQNVNLEPGSIIRTKNKPEILQANDQISKVVEPLIKVLLHQIAVSQGFSYGLLIRDLNNSNYSASRQNSQEDRRYFSTIQKMFSKRFVKPVYDTFVKQLVLKRLINVNGITQENLWKICECSISTDAFEYLNPLDEVQADILRLQNGLVSLQMLHAQKGVDYIKVLNQISREQKEISELGLNFTGLSQYQVNNNEVNNG